MTQQKVSLKEIVGGGYDDFWHSKKRYVVCKGSRASKKSTTAALKIVTRMMQYPLSNTLVVRKTGASLKDSCWTQLRWAIDRLGVSQYWKARVSPLELEYVPTGQKILFRGMDDPLKVTSITVKHGVLCYGWLNIPGQQKNLSNCWELLTHKGEDNQQRSYFRHITLEMV